MQLVVQPRRLNCYIKLIAFLLGKWGGGREVGACRKIPLDASHVIPWEDVWRGISYILPTAPVQQLYQLLLLLVTN